MAGGGCMVLQDRAESGEWSIRTSQLLEWDEFLKWPFWGGHDNRRPARNGLLFLPIRNAADEPCRHDPEIRWRSLLPNRIPRASGASGRFRRGTPFAGQVAAATWLPSFHRQNTRTLHRNASNPPRGGGCLSCARRSRSCWPTPTTTWASSRSSLAIARAQGGSSNQRFSRITVRKSDRHLTSRWMSERRR